MRKHSKKRIESLKERLQREQRPPTPEEAKLLGREPLDPKDYMEFLKKSWGDDAPDPEPPLHPTVIPEGSDAKEALEAMRSREVRKRRLEEAKSKAE
jgi:hypothetical protein